MFFFFIILKKIPGLNTNYPDDIYMTVVVN